MHASIRYAGHATRRHVHMKCTTTRTASPTSTPVHKIRGRRYRVRFLDRQARFSIPGACIRYAGHATRRHVHMKCTATRIASLTSTPVTNALCQNTSATLSRSLPRPSQNPNINPHMNCFTVKCKRYRDTTISRNRLAVELSIDC